MHDEEFTTLDILKDTARDIFAAVSLLAFGAGMVALMFAIQSTGNLPV